MEAVINETPEDTTLRQKLRALTLKLVPEKWSIIRLLLFQTIDKAPPGKLNELRDEIRNLLT